MIIYNVTVNVDDAVREEWKTYMLTEHIPDVLETGLFVGYRFCRVMVEEESGTTYSIQYQMKDLESYQLYEQLYAPKLRERHQERYGSKTVAFRTLLELIREHDT
ncbi:DUF4286 family protein [bacterium]|nr:DUF4286 family protein [bacterium]